ncbi:MAG: hypothetical protein ACJ70Z_07370 [Nitrososphaera sp.]
MKLVNQKNSNQFDQSFGARATAALSISIVVDALDYIGAPIFAVPIVGDIVDATVIAILYRLTGSKTSTAINSIELIPFIGDMIPAYTVSTLLWILKESTRKGRYQNNLLANQSNYTGPNTRINHDSEQRNIIYSDGNTQEKVSTRAARLYALFRKRE